MAHWLKKCLFPLFTQSRACSHMTAHTHTHTPLFNMARLSRRVSEVIIRTLWEYLLCRTEPPCHLLPSDRLTGRLPVSGQSVLLTQWGSLDTVNSPNCSWQMSCEAWEQTENTTRNGSQILRQSHAVNKKKIAPRGIVWADLPFRPCLLCPPEASAPALLRLSPLFCCLFSYQQPQPPPQPVRIIPSQSAQPTSLPKPVPSVQHAVRPPRPSHTPHAASLPTCPGRGKMAKFLSPDEMTSRDYYFDSYAHFGIHEVGRIASHRVHHGSSNESCMMSLFSIRENNKSQIIGNSFR